MEKITLCKWQESDENSLAMYANNNEIACFFDERFSSSLFARLEHY